MEDLISIIEHIGKTAIKSFKLPVSNNNCPHLLIRLQQLVLILNFHKSYTKFIRSSYGFN